MINCEKVLRAVAFSAAAVIPFCVIVRCISSCTDNNIKASEKSMEYVKTHSPNKYMEILEKSVGKSTFSGAEVWQQAAREVSDSLRIDSVARTNYAKGAQMVRDSIAKANLNDTVKTVMKSVK